MKRKWVLTGLIIIITGVVVGVITTFYVFRKTPESVGATKPDIVIDAAVLVSAYESDENAANEKYLNKVIEITGTVKSVIQNEQEISVTLTEHGSSSGIICNFSKSNVNKDLLTSGKKIRLKGICNGYLMDVILTKCELED